MKWLTKETLAELADLAAAGDLTSRELGMVLDAFAQARAAVEMREAVTEWLAAFDEHRHLVSQGIIPPKELSQALPDGIAKIRAVLAEAGRGEETPTK